MEINRPHNPATPAMGAHLTEAVSARKHTQMFRAGRLVSVESWPQPGDLSTAYSYNGIVHSRATCYDVNIPDKQVIVQRKPNIKHVSRHNPQPRAGLLRGWCPSGAGVLWELPGQGLCPPRATDPECARTLLGLSGVTFVSLCSLCMSVKSTKKI